MAKPHLHAVPKQSIKLYKALATVGDMTARDLADKLNILPTAVYRAVKPLIGLGLVEERNTYPTTYRAGSSAIALKWYLRMSAQSFRKDFGVNPKSVDEALPSITFIKDRTSLRVITEEEARKAKHSIDFILSGHRVADSTLADYRKAATRGVRLRVIIENNPKSPTVDLEAFKIMGAEAKFLPNLGIRLFIFDKHTAVLTSYDPTVPGRAFGIRFTYPPVAEQLSQIFEQRWQQATSL